MRAKAAGLSSKYESDEETTRIVDDSHRQYLAGRPRQRSPEDEDDFMPLVDVRRLYAEFLTDVERLTRALANPRAKGSANALADGNGHWNEAYQECRDEYRRLFVAIENIGHAFGGRAWCDTDERRARLARQQAETDAQSPFETAWDHMLASCSYWMSRLTQEERAILAAQIVRDLTSPVQP